MRMRASLFAAPNLDCFASRNDGIKTRATFPAVIARLDRATQYSRDACDGIEKPRRTGYPAGACHRARRRRDPVAGYDGRWSEERRDERTFLLSQPSISIFLEL